MIILRFALLWLMGTILCAQSSNQVPYDQHLNVYPLREYIDEVMGERRVHRPSLAFTLYVRTLPPVFLAEIYHSERIGEAQQPSHPASFLTLAIKNKSRIPQLLKPHILEPYYAPLTYVLWNSDMGLEKKQTTRLSAHLVQRQQLYEKYSVAASLDEEAISALQKMEIESDAISLDLLKAMSDVDYAPSTDPCVDHPSDPDTKGEVDLLRLVANYQAGISRDQRALLRHVAKKISDKISLEEKAKKKADAAAEAQKHTITSAKKTDPDSVTPDAEDSSGPETSPRPIATIFPMLARFAVPADASPALLEKLKALEAQTDALGETLRKAVHAQFQTLLTKSRIEAFRKLAIEQAPAFAQLETLTEEIRHELAPLLAQRPVACPAQLSPELFSRLQDCHAVKVGFEHDRTEKLCAWRIAHPNLRFSSKRTQTSFEFETTASSKRKPQKISKELTAELAAQSEIFKTRHLAIEAQSAALKKEIDALGHPQLYQDTLHQMGQYHLWLRYRLYYEAAFKPGLHPAQRRLLFGQALSELYK